MVEPDEMLVVLFLFSYDMTAEADFLTFNC